MQATSEQKIWEEFRAGSDEALSYIYQTYTNKLYNYGRQFSPNAELVRDAIQDLFCEIIQSRERLGTTTSIKYYLFASLKHKLARHLQKEGKLIYTDINKDDGGFEIDLADELDLFDKIFPSDVNKSIVEACEKLPQKQREAIAMYFFEEMSYDEIAKLMAMTKVKSARALVYRALESLANTLSFAELSSIVLVWLAC